MGLLETGVTEHDYQCTFAGLSCKYKTFFPFPDRAGQINFSPLFT